MKLGNENKISKLSGDSGQCPVSSPKINFWQYWSKPTQKQISKFSGLEQFCLIFLLLAKYFLTDCSYARFLKVVQGYFCYFDIVIMLITLKSVLIIVTNGGTTDIVGVLKGLKRKKKQKKLVDSVYKHGRKQKSIIGKCSHNV